MQAVRDVKERGRTCILDIEMEVSEAVAGLLGAEIWKEEGLGACMWDGCADVASTIGCQAGQEDGPQRALPVLAAAFGRGVGAEAEGSRFGQRGSDSGASEAG